MGNFIKIGLSALVLSVLLAFFVAGLIQSIFGTKFAVQRAHQNIQGINQFESIALSAPVPISKLYSYDKEFGTNLSYMANQLPSVSASQSVTAPDFVQLRKKAEEVPAEETNYWWNLFYICGGGIVVPVLNALLAKLTDELIYPWIKGWPCWRGFQKRKTR